VAFSDDNLKKDKKLIENPLDKICCIGGYTYMRSDGGTERSMGVIAQEIIKVAPEVVKVSRDGYLSVAHGNLIALLIEAIKEEKLKREALEKRIDELCAQFNKK
jgi:hypothetical protein